MSTPRSARLELRVTPAQKAMISQGAAERGLTLTEYAIGTLLAACVRDAAAGNETSWRLGWMRGTALVAADLVAPTEPDGWDAGAFPS